MNAIYSYYYRIESATAVSPTYMSLQTDINDKSAAGATSVLARPRQPPSPAFAQCAPSWWIGWWRCT